MPDAPDRDGRSTAGRGRPPQAAARRAGLEGVEKLLTNSLVALVDGLERRRYCCSCARRGIAGHRQRTSPPHCSMLRAKGRRSRWPERSLSQWGLHTIPCPEGHGPRCRPERPGGLRSANEPRAPHRGMEDRSEGRHSACSRSADAEGRPRRRWDAPARYLPSIQARPCNERTMRDVPRLSSIGRATSPVDR